MPGYNPCFRFSFVTYNPPKVPRPVEPFLSSGHHLQTPCTASAAACSKADPGPASHCPPPGAPVMGRGSRAGRWGAPVLGRGSRAGRWGAPVMGRGSQAGRWGAPVMGQGKQADRWGPQVMGQGKQADRWAGAKQAAWQG
eukprot:1157568-Pelagomonas_calceolata.AAC.4